MWIALPLLAMSDFVLDTNRVSRTQRHRLLGRARLMNVLLGVSRGQDWPGYLAGNFSTGGWWYYFPVAFAIKTPVALLASVNPHTLAFFNRFVGGPRHGYRWLDAHGNPRVNLS
jgi:hypothetical protein